MNVEGGLQLGDLWGIVRRRGQVAAFTALGVALVAYWIAMALPNLYTSSATVLVEPQSVDEELVRAGVQSSDLNERLHLMTAQILSRARLSDIIDKYKLYQEESRYLPRESVIDLMRDRINVEPVVPDLERATPGAKPNTEINEFQITFSDYDANTAAKVAQQLANDFIQNHIDARVQVSQKSLDFIQSELERLSSRIRDQEAQIAEVKKQNPGRLPEDLAANQRQMERVLADLAVAQRARAEAASDESFYQSQAATAQFMAAPNDTASPARQLELLKLQLSQYESRGFTDKHPDVISAKAQIAALEKSLAESGSNGDSTSSLLQQQAQAQANRAGLRRQAAQQEIDRLQATANEIQGQIASTPAVAEQLDALSREYDHLLASFQDFSKRHQEATVQAQLERRQLGEQFRVLESAFPAPAPSAPNRPLILMLGILFGGALGGGVAIVLEAADTTAHDPRRLQSSFGLPVLAAIPRIWLEADRVAQRRKRLRTVAATAAVVLFALAGGAANYMWVNGAPGFLQSSLSSGDDSGAPVAAGSGG